MKNNPLLQDFAIWLNPTSLAAFPKLEVMKLAASVMKSKAKEIPAGVQKTISQGLRNTPHDLGVFVLRLYFYQILHLDEFSLDLRKKQFVFLNGHWHYESTGLAFGFGENLRSALGETYQYYYTQPKGDLIEPLIRMRLIQPSWLDTDKKEVESAFIKHFKGADSTKQAFTITDLVRSFTEIFVLIRDKGGKVPAEFSMLGIYLTSMYLTLDQVGGAFDVKACYLFARDLEN